MLFKGLPKRVLRAHKEAQRRGLISFHARGDDVCAEDRLSTREITYLRAMNEWIKTFDLRESVLTLDLETVGGPRPEVARDLARVAFGHAMDRLGISPAKTEAFNQNVEQAEGKAFYPSAELDTHSKMLLEASAASPVELRNFKDEYIHALTNNSLGSILPHKDNDFVPWLLTQSADDILVALRCGFNQETQDIVQIVRHKDCDLTVALMAYTAYFDVSWFARPEIFEADFSSKVLADPLQYNSFVVPMLVGKRFADEGFYDNGFAQDFSLFGGRYEPYCNSPQTSDWPDWVIAADMFGKRMGREPQSPYLFGDLHAVYRSKNVERQARSG